MNLKIKTIIFVIISIVLCSGSFYYGIFSGNNKIIQNDQTDSGKLNNFFLETIVEEKNFIIDLDIEKANNVLNHIKRNKELLYQLIKDDSSNSLKYQQLIKNIDSYEKYFMALFKNYKRYQDHKSKRLELFKTLTTQVDIISTKLDKNRAKAYINTKEVNSGYSNIAISIEVINSKILELDLLVSELLLEKNRNQFKRKLNLIKDSYKNEIKNLRIVTYSLKDETFTNYSNFAEAAFNRSIVIIEDIFNAFKERNLINEQLSVYRKKIRDIKIERKTDKVVNLSNDSTKIYALALFISALIIIGFLFFISTKGSTSSMIKMVKDFDQSFDFTRRLEVKGRDEISIVSGHINNYLDNIQSKIEDIEVTAKSLGKDSEILNVSSQSYIINTDYVVENTNSFTTSTKLIKDSIKTIKYDVDEAKESLNIVADASNQMMSTIVEISNDSDRALSISTKAVEQAGIASNKVSTLGDAANEIGKVTEVISEISEQTNLLALNATIEAARAGDAGRGFAVVANEIKVLSKETAEATLQIKKQISDIQNATNENVLEIKRITTTINDVNEIVEGIVSALKEQSTASNDIANNISSAASGISNIDENISLSSTATNSLTEELNRAGGTFSTVLQNGDEVKAIISKVNSMTDKLEEQLNTLIRK
jgi:methyl-accepting chemotaxis protein